MRQLGKLYLQPIFECLLMTSAKNYFKNWWMYVKAIQTVRFGTFFETLYSPKIFRLTGFPFHNYYVEAAEHKTSSAKQAVQSITCFMFC